MMTDPATNASPLDPTIAEESIEAVDRGEASTSTEESEPITADVEGLTDKQMEVSLEYWQSAIKADVLTDSEETNATFFTYDEAPSCLYDPRQEGQRALTTKERRSLYIHLRADQENDNTGVTLTPADKEARIRRRAEIALVQGFADVALFKKSVLAELKAACQPILLEAVQGSTSTAQLQEMRAKVSDLAQTHSEFLKYAALTDGLIKTYATKYAGEKTDSPRTFIDSLNTKLYQMVELEGEPANDGGELVEFMSVASGLMRGISFADLLMSIDEMISLRSSMSQGAEQKGNEVEEAQYEKARQGVQSQVEAAIGAAGAGTMVGETAGQSVNAADAEDLPRSVAGQNSESSPDATTEDTPQTEDAPQIDDQATAGTAAQGEESPEAPKGKSDDQAV